MSFLPVFIVISFLLTLAGGFIFIYHSNKTHENRQDRERSSIYQTVGFGVMLMFAILTGFTIGHHHYTTLKTDERLPEPYKIEITKNFDEKGNVKRDTVYYYDVYHR